MLRQLLSEQRKPSLLISLPHIIASLGDGLPPPPPQFLFIFAKQNTKTPFPRAPFGRLSTNKKGGGEGVL